jgi:hypothetical protein
LLAIATKCDMSLAQPFHAPIDIFRNTTEELRSIAAQYAASNEASQLRPAPSNGRDAPFDVAIQDTGEGAKGSRKRVCAPWGAKGNRKRRRSTSPSTHCFWAPRGHECVSSTRWAHHGACFVCDTQVVRPLGGPLMSLGFDAWASLPQRGLGREISRWGWSHPCHRGLRGGSSPTNAGVSRVRGWVRPTPTGALR